MATGWIKMYRQFTEWEWYKNIPVRILFEHCLLKANHEDKKWQGAIIKKGSFVTSYENLSIETGLTYKQVRNALSKLKMTGEVAHKGHSQYSVITIKNWDKFQGEGSQLGSQRADEGQSKGSQRATTKEIKEIKEIENKRNISFQKKNDPFINPIKTFFCDEYEKVFKVKPFLSATDCIRLIELASDNKDIKEVIPEAVKRLKSIEFEGINFKPSASWLLKENNFERVMNGEFGGSEVVEKSTADILEEIRQKRLAEGKGDF